MTDRIVILNSGGPAFKICLARFRNTGLANLAGKISKEQYNYLLKPFTDKELFKWTTDTSEPRIDDLLEHGPSLVWLFEFIVITHNIILNTGKLNKEFLKLPEEFKNHITSIIKE